MVYFSFLFYFISFSLTQTTVHESVQLRNWISVTEEDVKLKLAPKHTNKKARIDGAEKVRRIKYKPCLFFKFHPDGCPLGDLCNNIHDENDNNDGNDNDNDKDH